jgi:membrane dipeptidase
MRIADAHCDTLTKFPTNPFNSENAHWNISKYNEIGGKFQIFAIFTPPELSGDAATSFVTKAIGDFHRYNAGEVALVKSKNDFRDDKINIMFSIEGASPIQHDISYLHSFYNMGVRAMGLTWNHRNFVADGIDEEYGLTKFGKEVVQEMEKIGMIVDVSHLNVNGFNDVVAITNKPFIASHSNVRSKCNHLRNLNDDQILEIKSRKGFIGLNFYSPFLSESEFVVKTDAIKHIEAFLKLGCEDVLGIGADFDGIDKSPFNDVLDYGSLADLMRIEMKLSEDLIDKILYSNLVDFVKQTI